MDIKEIKQIVDVIKRAGLTEFEIEEEGFKLRISRESKETNGNGQTATYTMPPFPMSPHIQAPASQGPEAATGSALPKEEPAGRLITSPMVGTFYSAPSPDAPTFVKVGDSLDEDSVVCIIEAMKVMNEIKAEMSGKLLEVLVSNGDSVEFGQPLFRVE